MVTEGRTELKYALPLAARAEVLRLAAPYVEADCNGDDLTPWLPQLRHVCGEPPIGYRVSSLYLDDVALTGYGKRMADLPIRNRMRIRTYGEPGSAAPVFLEAKRKLRRLVVKHRVLVCDTDQWAAFDGPRPWEAAAAQASPATRRLAERWAQVAERERLGVQCRVEYLRETFVQGEHRLTLDHRLAVARATDAHALRGPCPMALLPPGWFVLELKFNGPMPRWMRHLARALHLVPEPVSKFALGVAHAVRRSDDDVRRFTPPSLCKALAQVAR